MTKFRVLVIPGRIDQGLDVLAEMLRLSNLGNNSINLSVEVVTPSRATELDLVNMFRVQGQKFDCLHFLGHSDGSTFELASGDVLTEDHILSLCKDAGAKVLFMNSCASAALCQYAVNTTVAVAKYNGDTWFAVPTKDGLYHVSTQVWGFRGYYIRERLKGIFGEM
jgi:hypothetical protein